MVENSPALRSGGGAPPTLRICVVIPSILLYHVTVNIIFCFCVIFGGITRERVSCIVKLYQTIETLCAAHGITVTQLCRDCGVSRSSLTDLKMGRKQSLSAQTLSRIAGYFSVSVDSLLGVDTAGDTLGFDDFSYALFHETKELTPENKEKLLEMARFFRDQQAKGN